jgi:hypothetical protein
MTQMSLLVQASAASNGEAVRTLFRERPNTWISALDLMRVGGALSWRTRVAESRKPRFGGMYIVNRQERVDGVVHSFYRWVQNGVVPEPQSPSQNDTDSAEFADDFD